MTMTQQQISEAEVEIIRWGERILTPLIVSALIGLFIFGVTMRDTVAQLAGEHDRYNDTNAGIKTEVAKIVEKLDQQNSSQQKLELSVKRIEISQEFYKEQIEDVKSQNAEIIRLLRSNPENK